MPVAAILFFEVIALRSLVSFTDFPELDGFIVCGQEEVCSIFLRKPADLVDLFLDFQTLQIVELRLVTLERAVDVILGAALRQVLILLFLLEDHYSSTSISCGQKLAGMIELHRRDDVSFGYIIIYGSFDLGQTPAALALSISVHAGLDPIQSWALFFDVDFKRLFL